MFRHLFYTWLLANVLNPFLFLLHHCLKWKYSYDDAFSWLVQSGKSLFLCSLAFSTPLFLLAWACLWIIRQSPYAAGDRFLLWLITMPLLVMLEMLFIAMSFDPSRYVDLFIDLVPAVFAPVVAIIIRRRQFYQLIYSFQPVAES